MEGMCHGVMVAARAVTSSARASESSPVFFQIERKDLYDASIGLRWRFADSGHRLGQCAGAPRHPGAAANVILTIEVEDAFSVPW